MRNVSKPFLILAVLAGCLSGAATVHAGNYCDSSMWWYGSQGNFYGQDRLPYFAVHPPVYYSYVVPRPYGYSPFAYPPGVMTPERQYVAPVTVINRHVQRDSAPAASADQSAQVKPLRIANPFVDQDAGVVQAAALEQTAE